MLSLLESNSYDRLGDVDIGNDQKQSMGFLEVRSEISTNIQLLSTPIWFQEVNHSDTDRYSKKLETAGFRDTPTKADALDADDTAKVAPNNKRKLDAADPNAKTCPPKQARTSLRPGVRVR